MRLLPLLLFVIIFTAKTSLAQSCNCPDNYYALKQLLKDNYPGYQDKTSDTIRFTRFCDTILKNIEMASNDYECYLTLKRLISFFKDPHLTLNVNNTPANKNRIKEMFAAAPKVSVNSSSYRSRMNKNPIEGNWEIKDQGSYYMINIQRTETNKYIGKVINADSVFWQPGQIKCIITSKIRNCFSVQLFVRDHTPFTFPINFEKGDILDMGTFGVWQRANGSSNAGALDSLVKRKRNIELLKPTDQIIYLRIPSFDISNLEKLKEILKAGMPSNLTNKKLILDLRGNSGGSTLVSSILLPYVYNGPIQTEGSSFMSSKQNVDDFEKIVSQPAFKSLDKQTITAQITKFRSSPNTLVHYTEKRTQTLDSVYSIPTEIFILINGFCASTTEYFLLQARQNPKVKIIGQKTRGAIDYTDIGLPHLLSCQLFYYQNPMARSNRINTSRLDNVGITPDIQLPDEIDALEYLKASIHEQNKNW